MDTEGCAGGGGREQLTVFTTWLLWINRSGTSEVFSIKSQSRLLLLHDSQLDLKISHSDPRQFIPVIKAVKGMNRYRLKY